MVVLAIVLLAPSRATPTAALRFAVRCADPLPPQTVTIADGRAQVGEATADDASATRRGDRVALVANERTRLLVRPLRSGQVQRLRWPSSLASFGNAVAQPRGRLIAVSFANPPPARQLEVWLFDGVTSTFSPLTGLITQPADALPVDRSIRAGRAVTGERLTPRTAR